MLPFLLGLGTVAVARLLTLPTSLWEWDEVLFVRGVEDFDPLQHHPHPPGYPLLIGLGKLFALVTGDPFRGLVALSVVASLVGYAALFDAYRRLAAPPGAGEAERAAAKRAAVLGATLFHLSPAMLVYGPLALSDAPALAFLSLALAAAARLAAEPIRQTSGGEPAAALSRRRQSMPAIPAIALGGFAAAAIGVRPQLAIAVVPMLLVALLGGRGAGWMRRGRRLAVGTAAFAAVSLAWFMPLVAAVGGPGELVPFLTRQAGNVVVFDALQPRAGVSALAIMKRFRAHPWGTQLTSLPVLLLALAGAAALAVRLRGRRGAAVSGASAAGAPSFDDAGSSTPGPASSPLPLLVLAGTELALCLFLLNPDDAARYALPSMLAVAGAAGLGCVALARVARRPALAWVAGAALAAGFVAFTWPLLAVRATTLSPPVQAARWFAAAQESSAPPAVLLVEPSLAAHAEALLPQVERRPVAAGLPAAALARRAPAWLLGDGESGLAGARTFRWPVSDAYGKLTRRCYRVVSLSPLPRAQLFEARGGVHGPEPSLRQPGWRWLDAEAAIRLDGAGGSGDGGRGVAITLRLPQNVPWPANTVTVGLAGRTSSTVVLHRGETQRVVLPRGEGEFVDVTFRSRAAFVPAESGFGPDYRRLAVQLVGVEQVASSGLAPRHALDPLDGAPHPAGASRRPL